MADRDCNKACGCAVPCPGGATCRCSTGGAEMRHTLCACGDHCNCNPCSCGSAAARTAAGSACNCRPNCGCSACGTA